MRAILRFLALRLGVKRSWVQIPPARLETREVRKGLASSFQAFVSSSGGERRPAPKCTVWPRTAEKMTCVDLTTSKLRQSAGAPKSRNSRGRAARPDRSQRRQGSDGRIDLEQVGVRVDVGGQRRARVPHDGLRGPQGHACPRQVCSLHALAGRVRAARSTTVARQRSAGVHHE